MKYSKLPLQRPVVSTGAEIEQIEMASWGCRGRGEYASFRYPVLISILLFLQPACTLDLKGSMSIKDAGLEEEPSREMDQADETGSDLYDDMPWDLSELNDVEKEDVDGVETVVGCTLDSQCSDGEPCNGTEICSGGRCVPGSPLPDLAPCGYGICCGGICRTGGDCCRNTDCHAGCVGTVRECGDITDATRCREQQDCTWNTTEPGGCDGISDRCSSALEESYCRGYGPCGCSWECETISSDDAVEPVCSCQVIPGVCITITDRLLCTNCGCDWTPPGPGTCSGDAWPCYLMVSFLECENQIDCFWRSETCIDYQCR